MQREPANRDGIGVVGGEGWLKYRTHCAGAFIVS
jgi:hypothetical protein